jgi:TonB family protein
VSHVFAKFTRLTVAALIALAPLAATIVPAGAQGINVDDSCNVPNVQASTAYAAVADRPDVANEMHLTGTTLVQVDLDASGNLVGAEVAKSSGVGVLDRAAIAAARASTFRPAIQNCTPVPGSYLFEVDFDN